MQSHCRIGLGALVLGLSMFSGCATNKAQHEQVPQYSVVIDEPQRIRFSGKGAGAGMMLSSSMGPMGIAIGVAIDEGIAKDIQAAFEADGHSLESLVSSAIDEAYSLKGNAALTTTNNGEGLVIHLQRIGVKMSQGEDVVADIDGEVRRELDVALIADLATTGEPASMPLELLKTDGSATYLLLKSALVKAIYPLL